MPQHPEIQPGGEHRPTQPLHKLLHPRQRRRGVDDKRNGLDDPHARMGFHAPHQLDEGVPVHQAVGVQHHHVAEIAPPAAAEIRHIAALALEIDPPPAVMDASLGAKLPHRLRPGPLFLHQHIRLARVTEHEKGELLAEASGLQRQPGGAQTGEDPLRILVADRHQERGARRARQGLRRIGPHQEAISPGQQGNEPEDGCPESHRDPGEQDHEDREQGQSQEELLRTGQHASHDVGSGESGRRHQHGQQQAAPAGRAAPIAQGGIGHHRLRHALHGASRLGAGGGADSGWGSTWRVRQSSLSGSGSSEGDSMAPRWIGGMDTGARRWTDSHSPTPSTRTAKACAGVALAWGASAWATSMSKAE